MADTSNNTSSEVEQLRAQLDELRATDPAPILADAKQRAAAAVSNAASTVTESVATPIRRGADQVAGQVRGAVAGARRTAAQVDAQKESLSEQVRMRPFVALGVATAIGYVFGRIIR